MRILILYPFKINFQTCLQPRMQRKYSVHRKLLSVKARMRVLAEVSGTVESDRTRVYLTLLIEMLGFNTPTHRRWCPSCPSPLFTPITQHSKTSTSAFYFIYFEQV
ncbi:hypothetical protein H6F74_17850 [Trichocoleus sp. FACHB-90]|uniref:hypothetical protein n=1 Tax=Cyanophyceae TaxID=3028117 RepID=UPI0016829090|nr:hypothetical protein [Trichocoleus sp. FACHB-90]MBD1928095.1 hypothetical protein [Trichocoleus sp. FACHB-90]